MMDKIRKERKETLLSKLVLEWPTIGDASESALMKFFHTLEKIE